MKVISFKLERNKAEEAREILRGQKATLSSQIRKYVERVIDQNIPVSAELEGDRLVIITVKVPDELYQKISRFVEEKHVKRSALLRTAVYMFVEENKRAKNDLTPLNTT
ncbi:MULTISPECIES: ribbon-helix-helix domain-containing protein [Metallosphaera]|uniref:ribbon-helix-helix domain-containing protein n=1 Tax=Metallosphaera TaxID=41980 RepID=UPI001F06F687|nr:ribbon-helix-helix domain-containing protein [Metallosphaera sedula]MCH1771232.1 ribbon-helix-helix domain-containing protein [Metallosphaera sedula]MCP6729604.1 ribbon-helix-helix domain-containing protein [Metallosphaera sedula]